MKVIQFKRKPQKFNKGDIVRLNLQVEREPGEIGYLIKPQSKLEGEFIVIESNAGRTLEYDKENGIEWQENCYSIKSLYDGEESSWYYENELIFVRKMTPNDAFKAMSL